MHNHKKIINFLGLIQRAGKIVSGTDLVVSSIKTGKVKLVIIASDLSKATRQEIEALAQKKGLPIIDEFSELEISQAIGKTRKVLAVSDLGFSKAIQKKLNEGV
nr:50S ribosomal protein L7 [Lactobacillus jensenii]